MPTNQPSFGTDKAREGIEEAVQIVTRQEADISDSERIAITKAVMHLNTVGFTGMSPDFVQRMEQEARRIAEEIQRAVAFIATDFERPAIDDGVPFERLSPRKKVASLLATCIRAAITEPRHASMFVDEVHTRRLE